MIEGQHFVAWEPGVFVQLAIERGHISSGYVYLRLARICLMDAYVFSKPTAH